MRLPVHVTPKSGRGEVIGWRDGADGQRELEVKVKAAPEKGKATKEAIALIASFLMYQKFRHLRTWRDESSQDVRGS